MKDLSMFKHKRLIPSLTGHYDYVGDYIQKNDAAGYKVADSKIKARSGNEPQRAYE
jgi:hypothetical protein